MPSKPLGNWSDSPCWYVSVRDAGHTALVLGPFQLEAECRQYAYSASDGQPDTEPGGNTAKHFALVKLAESRDCKAWFYAWGMVKMPHGHHSGILNGLMRPDGLWNGTLADDGLTVETRP